LTWKFFCRGTDGFPEKIVKGAEGDHQGHLNRGGIPYAPFKGSIMPPPEAVKSGKVAPLTDAHWHMSGGVVLLTLLGGLGTLFGPVVGAFTILALENELADKVGPWVTVIMGVIFVVLGRPVNEPGSPASGPDRRRTMRITYSFDERTEEGFTAWRSIQHFKRIVEDPAAAGLATGAGDDAGQDTEVLVLHGDSREALVARAEGVRRFLAERPRIFKEDGFLFVHGSARNPLNEYVFPEDIYNQRKMDRIFALIDRYCFQGHTHVPGVFTESLQDDSYLFQAPDDIDSTHKLDERKTMVKERIEQGRL